MLNLLDHFDRVVVVNLDKFPNRWAQFQRRAELAGLTGFERVRAIEGDRVKPPDWWRAGDGAFGCMMSHCRVLQDAISDNLSRVLIFEDDAVFSPDAMDRIPAIMGEVKDDWDMLFFGGQHMWHCGNAYRFNGYETVVRARNLGRTHAFAVARRFMVKLHKHILAVPDYIQHPKWHVDHQIGALIYRQEDVVLAAQPWVCGQAGGNSYISGKVNPEMWWHQPSDRIDSESVILQESPDQPFTDNTYPAKTIVPLAMAIAKPKVVCDWGCNYGNWLSECKKLGAEVHGFDGMPFTPHKAKILESEYTMADFEEEIPVRECDLAICVEVAEHLTKDRSDPLVDALTASAPVVVFSGATPGQGGHGHINERPHSYWHAKFLRRGYLLHDCIRWCINDDPEMYPWYSKNVFVYSKVPLPRP